MTGRVPADAKRVLSAAIAVLRSGVWDSCGDVDLLVAVKGDLTLSYQRPALKLGSLAEASERIAASSPRLPNAFPYRLEIRASEKLFRARWDDFGNLDWQFIHRGAWESELCADEPGQALALPG